MPKPDGSARVAAATPLSLSALPALPLARGGLDRLVDRRNDEAWLAEQWERPLTRRYAVCRSRVVLDDDGRLRTFPVTEAPDGDRYLLGVDELGITHIAVSTQTPQPGSISLRRVAPLLSDRDGSLAVHAVGLSIWHANHSHCPRCGSPTTIGAAGHVRRCPADGSEHHPRTDPAVITLVVDPGGRALLARGVGWSPAQYALLAGFVEPGESAEQAVAREVHEEVGVRIDDVTYLGSQPHPFPSSLMIGFIARTRDTTLRIDETELEDARWTSRDDLRRALTSGEIAFAPSVSIARTMIENWYGAPIP